MDAAPRPPSRTVLARVSLGGAIAFAAVAGLVVGWAFPTTALELAWISDLFLRLVRMLLAPLLFGVLVPAIANASAPRELARLGWRAVVVFEVATTAALLLGWGMALALGVGAGVALPVAPAAASPAAFSLKDVVLNAVPTSVIDAMARGDVLQIVTFCLLFGAAALSAGPAARALVAFAEAVAAVAFRCTAWIMWLAPAAVFSALAATVAANGARLLQGLGGLVLSAWLAEATFLVLLAVVLALCRVPLRRFVAWVKEPFLIGMATSSSAAALPQTLAGLERFGVSAEVRGFVTPLSLTLHMNGAAVYFGVATIFLARAAGQPLPFATQVMMLLTLKIASKGVTGIPRATVVILAAVCEQFGLPGSGVTLLLGVDALIDPIRTAVNVASHCAGPVLVQAWTQRRAVARVT